MKIRRIAAVVGSSLLIPALTLALGGPTAGARTVAHQAPVINHQFCFVARPSLCMATEHAGVNASMVLRVNGHTRAQAITWGNGRLRIKGHPGNLCVGGDLHLAEARTAHCNGGHGIRWRLIVFPGRGIGFDNVAADRADPGPRQHFLEVTAQQRGQILAIGSSLHNPHIFRDCAGHCAHAIVRTTAAVQRHEAKRRIFDCTIAKIQMLKVWRALDRFAPKWHREAYASAHCSVTHPPRTWNSSTGIQKVVFDKVKQKKVWRTMFSTPPVRVIPSPNKFYRLYAPCVRGTYRSYIDVWGFSSTRVWHKHQKHFSKPLGILDCVTPPGEGGSVVSTVSLRSHSVPAASHHAPIFGEGGDCDNPYLHISRFNDGHNGPPVLGWGGHLGCNDLPTKLTSFMTFQQQVRRPVKHWELRHVTPTHEGVTLLTSGRWVVDIKPKARKCATGRFRVSWTSHGLSSTGDRHENTFCSPVIRVANCSPGGNNVFKHGAHKCPNPLHQ